jgi:predicted dehydrogenase
VPDLSLPSPHIINPASVPALRWGIIGPGGIAQSFADSIHKHTTQRVVAVASQTPGKAEAFAGPRDIKHALTSYQDLVEHPDVDVVYVATTHEFHREHAELAIAAGKHVLIEKPVAVNPEDAEAIRVAAEAAGVLAMEAMWTRYLPQSDIIRRVLADGLLGNIELVLSDFGQDLRMIPRLMSPVSGGALLDLGIYNFAFTSLVLGAAATLTSVGTLTDTGVDDTTANLMTYTSGARAIANVTLSAFTPTAASIAGTAALLRVDSPFFTPTGLSLFPAEFNAAPAATWTDTSGIAAHEGLCYQATAMASFVEQGLTDSPLRPLAEAVSDIELITQARHQVGAYLTGERS